MQAGLEEERDTTDSFLIHTTVEYFALNTEGESQVSVVGLSVCAMCDSSPRVHFCWRSAAVQVTMDGVDG